MHLSTLAPLRAPLPRFVAEDALRSGMRLTRVGMFMAETLTRLVLDGAGTSLEDRARELAWVAENLCALTGVRPRVHGQVPKGPCVLVANHVSYLDPMVLTGLVRCAPVAKAEVEHWPCVGEVARRVGVLFVKRSCPHSGARVLRESLRALAQGVSVLVFPEGTTSAGHSVLPFQRGAFGLARLAGVPIVPAVVEYKEREAAWVGDETFLPHFTRTVRRAVTSMSVRFLPPIDAELGNARELANMAHAQIQRHLPGSHVAPHSFHVRPYVRAVA